MCKEFKFKVGREFISLKQFKDAVLYHSVLNGREVTFPTNDKIRVKVECTRNCSFKMFWSKVGGKETFKTKTICPKHTCGRVYNNKNETSAWIAKVVAWKFQSHGDIKVSEVMTDLQQEYSVGVTHWRAWKGRVIAKEIVEGDATKQYTMLWAYSAELRRANARNTCKINVYMPSLLLQPRFDKFYMCLDACKKGFTICRHFIGVDGCHLKNKYGGCLLIAVGRDPNDQYSP